MSEAIRQLQVHTQRALAAAHVIDQQIESPASARVIAAGRAFIAAVLDLAVEQAPRPAVVAEPPVPALPAAPEPPQPPKVPEDVAQWNAEIAAWTEMLPKHPDLPALVRELRQFVIASDRRMSDLREAGNGHTASTLDAKPMLREKLRLAERQLATTGAAR